MWRLRWQAVLLVKPRVAQASDGSGEWVPPACAWEPPARGRASPVSGPKGVRLSRSPSSGTGGAPCSSPPPFPCGKQVAHTLNVSADGVGACAGILSQVTVFSSASVFAARAQPMCLLLRLAHVYKTV